MAYDLTPSRLLSFPTLNLQSFWNDDELITNASNPSGLSVSEDDTHIYIESAIPGLDPKDIEITFQDGYLWIRGDKKEEESDKKRKYYRQATRSFSYRVAVPGDIDHTQEPKATYKHGVMSVSFAKSPKAQPKKINIQIDQT